MLRLSPGIIAARLSLTQRLGHTLQRCARRRPRCIQRPNRRGDQSLIDRPIAKHFVHSQGKRPPDRNPSRHLDPKHIRLVASSEANRPIQHGPRQGPTSPQPGRHISDEVNRHLRPPPNRNAVASAAQLPATEPHQQRNRNRQQRTPQHRRSNDAETRTQPMS